MKIGEQIFKLIKAMRKDEKRHFKWYTSRYAKNKPKATSLLFDIMNKLETYEEEEVVLAAQKQQIKNLHYVKLSLKKEILQALTDSKFNRSDKIEPLDTCLKAMIGLDAGLPIITEEWVNKGKQAIDPYEQAIDTYRLNSELLVAFVRFAPLTRKKEIQELLEELQENLRSEENALQYLILSTNFWIWYTELERPISEEHMKAIKPLVDSVWFQDESLPLSFSSKRSLFFCKYIYQTISEDGEKARSYMGKIVDLYEDTPRFKQSHRELYITDVFNLAMTYLESKLFTETNQLIILLEQFEKEFLNPKDLSWNTYQSHTIMIKAYHNYLIGEAEAIIDLIPAIKTYYLDTKNRYMPHNLLYFYFFIINAFFSLGREEEALHWISKFYHEDFKHKPPKVELGIRLIEIWIHYNKGHYSLSDSLLKRIKYFVQTKKVNTEFWEAPVKTLRLLIKKEEKQYIKLTGKLEEELLLLQKAEYIKDLAEVLLQEIKKIEGL